MATLFKCYDDVLKVVVTADVVDGGDVKLTIADPPTVSVNLPMVESNVFLAAFAISRGSNPTAKAYANLFRQAWQSDAQTQQAAERRVEVACDAVVTEPMNISEAALKALKALSVVAAGCLDDPDDAHYSADAILAEFVRDIGAADVAKAWDDIQPKWYS